MAKASLIGLITQGPELQHSAKGEPYVRFSVAEYVGFGLLTCGHGATWRSGLQSAVLVTAILSF